MDFIIRKVNGIDLTDASHEETVRTFYNANEPIVVEVVKRLSENSLPQDITSTCQPGVEQILVQNQIAADIPKSTKKRCTCMDNKQMNSQGTQTESFVENDYFRKMFFAPSPPPLHGANIIFDDATSNSTSDQSYDILNDDSSFAYDMEYEEITLHRSTAGDRIGLTLCYGPPDNSGITDIFIGDVEPESIAGRDGRIHEGDQILQINGQEAHTREEAIKLFSESKSQIKLQVCRPCLQLDDGFVDEAFTPVTDQTEDKHSKDLKQPALSNIAEDPEEKYEEDSLLTDTATLPSLKEKEGKDSGVGHDSDRQNELSDQDYDSPQYEIHKSNYTEHEYQELEQFCNFRDVLEARCTANTEKIVDLEMLYKQMEALCRLIEQQQSQYELLADQGSSGSRVVPKMGTRLMSNGDSSLPSTPSKSSETSPQSTFNNKLIDSGQNFVEGKRAARDRIGKKNNDIKQAFPLTLELNKNHMGSMLSLASEHIYDVIRSTPDSPSLPTPPVKSTRILNATSVPYELPHPNQLRDSSAEGCKSRDSSASSSRKHKGTSKKPSDCQPTRARSPGKCANTGNKLQKHTNHPEIAYTNEENLAFTIAIQQKLLLEQAKHSPQHSVKEKTQNFTPAYNLADNPSVPHMEWVLKRRSDGTRYITRRPIRKKLLSERKKKLEDERSGVTTDDDAMSEMKTGRYWSKEDRKAHFQKAKEYRKRKELTKAKQDEIKVSEEKNSIDKNNKKQSNKVKEKTPERVVGHLKSQPKFGNNLLSVTTV